MQEKIRKDIIEIDVIPLSVVGKCNLMAFDEATLKFGTGMLQLKVTRQNLTSQGRWEELIRLCTDYAKSYSLPMDWALAFRLKKELGVENEWLPYDSQISPKNMTVEIKKEVEYVAPWESDSDGESRDKFIENNFKKAYQFEANRGPVNNAVNPSWRFLLSEQKKKMFSWFPHLREMHERDWCALRNWMDTNPVLIPTEFLCDSKVEQMTIGQKLEPIKKAWSQQDKDLIDWVNHNWSADLWGKFSSAVAEKLRVEINKGPDGPTAQDRCLQDALHHIKLLILRIPGNENQLQDNTGSFY